jgi:SAM-dependent methyltransferase
MSDSGSSGDFEFEALRHAVHYRAAIAGEFRGALRGRVLEVGAGIGQMTETFLAEPAIREVVAVEPDPRFVERFREKLPEQRIVAGSTADLAAVEVFDAAVMINVLEHIEADVEELARIARHLRPGSGHVCILVPVRPELYAPIDRAFGHFRRYTRRTLGDALRQAGYAVERMHYLNAVGYLAWGVRFRLLGATTFKPHEVAFFDNWIFPPTNWFERTICRPFVGQSLVAIGRRVAGGS